MLSLVRRAACDKEKSPLIDGAHPAKRFSDVRADRIGCPYQLNSNGPPVEAGPGGRGFPKCVSERGRLPVYEQILELTAFHVSERRRGPKPAPVPSYCQLPTVNCQL